MVNRIASFTLSLTSVLLGIPATNAFAPSASSLTQRHTTNNSLRTPPQPSSPLTTLSQSAPFTDATTPVQQIDANGKVFTPGTTIAIAPSSHPVKAYQVPKAAFGTFDPTTRQFIPQDAENVTRGTSCLVLPEGMRGEVLRVYDVNEWDRTHPILVKFVGGSDREGEGAFDIPKTFMMHFDADEILVVD